MIPTQLRKFTKEIEIPTFVQNIDIFYFKNKKGQITGKIDFTKKTITGNYFKKFKKG